MQNIIFCEVFYNFNIVLVTYSGKKSGTASEREWNMSVYFKVWTVCSIQVAFFTHSFTDIQVFFSSIMAIEDYYDKALSLLLLWRNGVKQSNQHSIYMVNNFEKILSMCGYFLIFLFFIFDFCGNGNSTFYKFPKSVHVLISKVYECPVWTKVLFLKIFCHLNYTLKLKTKIGWLYAVLFQSIHQVYMITYSMIMVMRFVWHKECITYIIKTVRGASNDPILLLSRYLRCLMRANRVDFNAKPII